jgi:Protein of unknown function (DUF1214)
MSKTHDAFIELLDVLRALPETFTDELKGLGPQSQIQGYRHLAHLLSYGFELYLESDPLRPAFVPLARPTQKILGDNTDSVYCFTQVRGDQRYRIWGIRGDACYLSFCAYAGEPDGSWSDSLAVNINHTHIDFDDDGSFDIVVGPSEPDASNRFDMGARAVCIISREYYFDRDHDRLAEIHIENVADIEAPGPETDSTLGAKLAAVTNFVNQTAAMIPPPSSDEPNQLGDPFGFEPDGMGWGTPDNIYAMGSFRLADDEIMVIEGRSPKCCYWGVQTWNHYLQSFDARYHQVSRNSKQVTLNPDGSWTIYVSKQDPGLGNWVGTAGHDEGIVFCRWLLAEAMPDRPSSRVAKLASLR